MEIITYVLEGALEHQDSMGTGSVIRPGEVQRMSAGTGITHSEFNHNKNQELHLLQIWILPERTGLVPSYEQKTFSEEERTNRFRLVASREARDGSVTVHQDVSLYIALIEPGRAVTHAFAPGRHGWLHVARGAVSVLSNDLITGDGAAISDMREVTITAKEPSAIKEPSPTRHAAEVLLFDLH
jgi:redox-sensitive bicupin YhaK (pirin superfamily)